MKYHHIHISPAAHEELKRRATKEKVSIRVVVDRLLAENLKAKKSTS